MNSEWFSCYSQDDKGNRPLAVMSLSDYLAWITNDLETIENGSPYVWHCPGMFVKTSPFAEPSDRRILYTDDVQPEDVDRDQLHHELILANCPLRNMCKNSIRRLLKGENRVVSLDNFEKLKLSYKIHLMLSPRQLKSGGLQKLVSLVCRDIMGLKYRLPSQKELIPSSQIADEDGDTNENSQKRANPTVVIYCRPDLVLAQKVLMTVVSLFGDLPVENFKEPRYNIHVKGPVFYAGGDGNIKDDLLDYRITENHKHPEVDDLFDASVGYALYVGQPRLWDTS